MRGDDDLLKAHAVEKARQAVRLSAERRTVRGEAQSDGLSGPRVVLCALFLTLAMSAIFVGVQFVDPKALSVRVVDAIYLLPLLIPTAMVMLCDRRGTAGWPRHVLIGMVATILLLGVPLIIWILGSQLLPYGADKSVWGQAFEYTPNVLAYMVLYLPAALVTAPVTGLGLQWWARRTRT